MDAENEEFLKRLKEAENRIGFYTKEWENRSPSDPGITILENVVLLGQLLREQTKQVPLEVKEKLLKLYGIEKENGQSARVLLQPEQITRELHLPAHQKFYAGQLCFETVRKETVFPGKLQKVFTKTDGGIEEISELSHGNPLSAHIFGVQPKAGSTIYLLFDGILKEKERPLLLYVTTDERIPRNPAKKEQLPVFAKARWSYYTQNGYQEMRCEDDSGLFIRSGEMKLWFGDAQPEKTTLAGEEGFVIRCELLWADYDISPVVTGIDGPLLEVWERDSKAVVYTADKGEALEIEDIFQGETCTWVYGKGENGYQKLNRDTLEMKRKAVCMQKETAVQKDLGILYGYDGQEFDVGMFGTLLPESLELMVTETQKDGTKTVHFFRQGETTKEEDLPVFCYEAETGIIRILDAGAYTGCRLSIAACACCHGAKGNIRKKNRFIRMGGGRQEEYYNPNVGDGGKDNESFEDMCRRFQEQVRNTQTAVTGADYERLVREIPGLCIHKVHAYAGTDGEAVLVVKPYGREARPTLSDRYQKQIREYLEDKRLLCTKIRIKGPVYIPIPVHAVIQVKAQYQNSREEIKRALKEALDFINGEHEIGEAVSYAEICGVIEQLPCVEYLKELSMKGERRDVVLPPDGLACAGTFELELKYSRIV